MWTAGTRRGVEARVNNGGQEGEAGGRNYRDGGRSSEGDRDGGTDGTLICFRFSSRRGMGEGLGGFSHCLLGPPFRRRLRRQVLLETETPRLTSDSTQDPSSSISQGLGVQAWVLPDAGDRTQDFVRAELT